jgi:hypothetical protein
VRDDENHDRVAGGSGHGRARDPGRARRRSIRLGGRSQVEAVDWTGVNQVTVHTVEPLAKERRVRILEVDMATGATKVRDHYTIRGAYGFAACGG